jgi:hypothetical protein
MQILTLINCTVEKKAFALPHKQSKGFHKYINITDVTDLQYPILRDDGVCVVPEIAGYTKDGEFNFINNKTLLADDTIIDFTNGGVNIDIPIQLNDWNTNNLSGLEGSQLFYNIDANKNTKKHLVYSQPLSGDSANQTNNYVKAPFLTDDNGVVLTDDNGEKLTNY